MAKYTITYNDNTSAESNANTITVVNQLPSPIPTSGAWSAYRHGGKCVLEISTEDEDAKVEIVPPTGGPLSDQNVAATLGVSSGQATAFTWDTSVAGVVLALVGDAPSSTFHVTDASLPLQTLRVMTRRP